MTNFDFLKSEQKFVVSAAQTDKSKFEIKQSLEKVELLKNTNEKIV